MVVDEDDVGEEDEEEEGRLRTAERLHRVGLQSHGNPEEALPHRLRNWQSSNRDKVCSKEMARPEKAAAPKDKEERSDDADEYQGHPLFCFTSLQLQSRRTFNFLNHASQQRGFHTPQSRLWKRMKNVNNGASSKADCSNVAKYAFHHNEKGNNV